MVREGESTSSKAMDERLAKGAIVEQVELIGDRLHYNNKKVGTGSGPIEGWVAVKIKSSVLMEKTGEVFATPDAQISSRPAAALATVASPEETQDDPMPLWAPIPETIWKTYPKLEDIESLRPKSLKQFKERVNNDDAGEYWGIKFPFSPQMLREMGPEWLTLAMHTAGTLPKNDAVTKFIEFDVKAEDVTKQDAENAKWGGAGLKILLGVEFKNGGTQSMFIKMPHEYTTKNERVKNSFGNGGMMDWSEVTWYNVCGGRFGRLPFKSPKMYFCDMCRHTTNFINIVERIPYAPTGTMQVAPGQYYPAPEKYKDWALPNNGVDLYYAHAKALAQFFAWCRMTSKKTDQLERVFGANPATKPIHDFVKAAGAYNSKARDATISKGLTSDPAIKGAAAAMGFAPSTAKGFLDLGVEFITNVCPQAMPKELVAKPYVDKLKAEAEEMSSYCGEMNFYMAAIPEFASLCHPNAQVDNAFYWKNQAGEVQCGLLDWGGVSHSNIPTCIGNGWMGAEPEVMAEHEEKLIKLFIDEYALVTGFIFDLEDLFMNMKLAQCSVFFGCLANVGTALRILKKDEWAKIKGRKDPRIDENFLLRCYWVQVYLWWKMWGMKNSPYLFFKRWMKRLELPKK